MAAGHSGGASPDLCPVCGRQGYLDHIDLRTSMKRMACRACGMTWRAPVHRSDEGTEDPDRSRWTLTALGERAAEPARPVEPDEPDWLRRLRVIASEETRSVRPRDLQRLLRERDHLLAHADPATAAEIAAIESR